MKKREKYVFVVSLIFSALTPILLGSWSQEEGLSESRDKTADSATRGAKGVPVEVLQLLESEFKGSVVKSVVEMRAIDYGNPNHEDPRSFEAKIVEKIDGNASIQSTVFIRMYFNREEERMVCYTTRRVRNLESLSEINAILADIEFSIPQNYDKINLDDANEKLNKAGIEITIPAELGFKEVARKAQGFLVSGKIVSVAAIDVLYDSAERFVLARHPPHVAQDTDGKGVPISQLTHNGRDYALILAFPLARAGKSPLAVESYFDSESEEEVRSLEDGEELGILLKAGLSAGLDSEGQPAIIITASRQNESPYFTTWEGVGPH